MTRPVTLSVSGRVKIKENRYEIFAVHSFNISPEMVLQSSLTTEFSKIVANNILVGGAIDRRDTSFTYLKPRFNFRYDVTSLDQVRLLVEKKVSQLDFNNFVTRFDQMEQIFKPGNTKIRHEAEGLRHSRGTSTVLYYLDHIRFDDLYERKVQH